MGTTTLLRMKRIERNKDRRSTVSANWKEMGNEFKQKERKIR